MVRASYRFLDYGAAAEGAGRYARRTGEGEGQDTGYRRPETGDRMSGGTGLTLAGTKSLGFSAGTSGAALEQATRIAVGGEYEGIAIDAELSDQSSPIPPEGTTRELEELDRILINVKGQDWRGTFGDVEVGADAGALGRLVRRATGAVVAGSVGPVSAGLGYARPRGKFGRVVLNGMDRVQGPYLLAPDGRSAQIVPGSEEVYLDGVRLTRGWDEDYTIDYSTGELVFTARHVIDAWSRIEAGFQYVTEAYERAVTGGEVSLGSAAGASSGLGSAELAVGVFREGDDPERSLAEEPSEEEREYLGSVGRDTARAWLPGATYVGPGAGDYERVEDYFRFTGRGRGDYQVRFTYVGESGGAYRYDDSSGAFVHVGAGQGRYADSVKVALPERSEAAFCRIGLGQGGLASRLDAAFQRRSPNLFSGPGVRDDAAGADFELGWQDSVYAVKYRHRTQASGFALPGRASAVDFTRTWAGTTEEERRASGELTGRVKLRPEVELRGELGRLLRTDERAVDRVGGGFRVWWLDCDAAKAAATVRHGLALSPRVWWLQPRAGWESEANDTARVRSASLGTGFAPPAGPAGRLDSRLADYEEMGAAGWTRTSRGTLVQSVLDWSPRAGYRLEAALAHQARRFEGGTEPDWSQFQGSVGSAIAPSAGLRLQADGSQSYRRVQLRDEQFFYVGPKQGQYRLDSLTGRFVYDPDGEYRRAVVATDRFAAARELAGSVSAQLTAAGPWGFSGSAGANQASADTGVLTGSGTYDARLEWNGREPLPAVALGASGSAGLDRTLAFTGRESQRRVEFVEVSGTGQVLADVRVRVERVDAVRRYTSALLDYTEAGWRGEARAALAPPLGIELGLGLETKELSEPAAYPELGRFRLSGVDAGLTRTWQVREHTRITGNAAVMWWTASVGEVPFDVALTSPPGLTPSVRVSLEHVVSTVLTGSARYAFSDRPDRSAEHVVAIGLRAYF